MLDRRNIASRRVPAMAALVVLLFAWAEPLDAEVLTGIDGEEYVGETKNEVQHGKGAQEWPDGARYVGEWRYGDKHGEGSFYWPGGARYSGGWREDKWHGQGTYTRADGTVLKGEWRNGDFWNGIETMPDGSEHRWVNGIRQ